MLGPLRRVRDVNAACPEFLDAILSAGTGRATRRTPSVIRAEPLRKFTYVGSVRVEAVSLDGGRSWVWPPEMAAEILAAQEQRREIFNVWTKKRKRGVKS